MKEDIPENSVSREKKSWAEKKKKIKAYFNDIIWISPFGQVWRLFHTGLFCYYDLIHSDSIYIRFKVYVSQYEFVLKTVSLSGCTTFTKHYSSV